MTSMTSERKTFFKKQWGCVEMPNLINAQTKPYADFLQLDIFPEKREKKGLQGIFEETFPISSYDGRMTIEFISYRFSSPKYSVEECIDMGVTYEASLHVLFRLTDDTGIKEEEVFLGNIPMMTSKGAFVINGAERVLVSQIHRSPGIYFEKENVKGSKKLVGTSSCSFKIIPYRGTWLVAELDSSDIVYMYMERNKKRRRVLATTFLRAIGISSNEDILSRFYDIEQIQFNTEEEIGDIVGKILAKTVFDEDQRVIAKSGDSLTTASLIQILKLGIRELEIVKHADASDIVIRMIREDTTDNHRDALKTCFRKLYPDEPATISNARFGLMRFFFDKNRYSLGEVGRYKINKRLGLPVDKETLKNTLLRQEDLVLAIKELIAIKNGEGYSKLDDIDHLSNRRVRLSGELVYNQCKIGASRIEKIVREKLSMSDVSNDNITPGRLISSKMFTMSVKELFSRSRLSQFMDQVNPLAELTHKRRISALGPGGIQRDRAGFEIRDVHTSHYGRICPVETPEGPSIGLITSISAFARFNEFGFIETPYFIVNKGVVSSEMTYYSADQEEGLTIAQSTTNVSESGEIEDEICIVRKDGEILEVGKYEVDLLEVSPSQLFSAGANLIPFIEHDDANRALMGANMQRQAVPIMKTEAPIIGTGIESKIAKDSGAVILSPCDGTVKYVDGKNIIITSEDGRDFSIELKKYKRSNNGTCINYKAIVYIGQKVSKDDCIADGPSVKDGELALGKNVLVAFMPYYGKNFEDAIIVSEELIKQDAFTCVRIERLDLMARDTKLGKEEITRDIPNVSDESIKCLDEDGIIKIGSRVSPGDILVGKVTPKLETELSPEERFLRAIFKDKAQSVKDTSLVAPVGTEGVVIDVRIFSRKDKIARSDDEIVSEVSEIKNIKRSYKNSIELIEKNTKQQLIDIFSGVIAPEFLAHRKTGELILNKDDVITLSDIEKLMKINAVDILDINEPLYVQLRNIIKDMELQKEKEDFKYKQVLEETRKGDTFLDTGVIKHVIIHIAKKSQLEIGDKMAGRHGNKGVVSTSVPIEDMPYMEDGTPVQMILNPLGVPSRMNIGQIAETHLGWAAHVLNYKISCPVFLGCKDEELNRMMQEAGLPEDGKAILYNGFTGDRLINRVSVGYMYMLRLAHFVSDKMHARATGPYSFITQQPLGGKSRFGGQRFGEMEVWAIESYGSSNVLMELLTVKSDDVAGRTMIYQNIVKGDNRLRTTQTESLRVLLKELQGLCLDARMESDGGETHEDSSISMLTSDIDEDFESSQKFDKLKINLASEHVIRNVWSHGEVKKAETINYRTLRPERGGLFCEKIFGPTKDWECSCGKYKKVKNKGIVCDRCGVEVTVSRVRRERMAHIDLAIPVIHIWLLKNVPSRLGSLLGLSVTQLERIIYYENYIVTDPKESGLLSKHLLTQQEYQEAVDKYGVDGFVAKMGGEAIKDLLKTEDLRQVSNDLKLAVKKTKSTQARSKLARRLKIVEGFLKSKNSLDSLVLSSIPVIPPDIRPLVKLDGGRFAASDINDLYRRVIHRNNRLKVILKIVKTPDVIIRNEMRLLQESVDALFDNGRRGTVISGVGNRPLKPLAQSLKGKHGRFRQNLLGKRVDYSGRSVIVVGPELKMNQCGIPKEMALQLFEPFIVRRLRILGKTRTVRSARKLIQKQAQEVWDVLEDITKQHTVILNRAPTLHRLSIQAFQPVLVEGKAIRIHPLVCTAFNADFDGDQMAVHIPLCVGAQAEARLLMMASDNIFLPASGKPIVMPTRDMTLGVYSLMLDPIYNPEEVGKPVRKFASVKEVLHALITADQTRWDLPGEVNINNDPLGSSIFLHEKIQLKLQNGLIYTTPGRSIFNTIVPKELGFQNYAMTQSKLSKLIMECYKKLGLERTVVFLDDLKDLGFSVSTDFAVSMGLLDICKIDEKQSVLDRASVQIAKIRNQYKVGIITSGEMESKEIGVWTSVGDEIAKPLFSKLEKIKDYRQNPLYTILDSGARGNKSQVRQLGGLRGLVARPSGSIITFPIKSSFREGLSPIEFFISTHGGRKGLADTALKTADAGYLTRRLVDVAQEIVIKEENCGAINGIDVSAITHMNEEILPIRDRIQGRTSCDAIYAPGSGDIIVNAGDIITEKQATLIESLGINTVKIRSPLTCLTDRGVCVKCYGINLADGKTVVPGEAVGIIAAQSIGEPGTQLTMRTFHLGGVASTEVHPEWVVEKEGVVIFKDVRFIRVVQDNVLLSVGRNGTVNIMEDTGKTIEQYIALLDEKSVEPIQSFNCDIGVRILVENGQRVSPGNKIAELETHSVPIISEQDGIVVWEDLIEGVTTEKLTNRKTGQEEILVKNHRDDIYPQINIVSASDPKILFGSYNIPVGAVLSSREGDAVKTGDILARIPRASMKTSDITGGLSRVAEIFEARKSSDIAEIASIEGIVDFRGIQKGRRIIAITDPGDSSIEVEHMIPINKHIIVNKGDRVIEGQQLTNGTPSPDEILKICGVRYLQRHLVDQVQEIYRLQGVDINDKHIEIIIKQMLNKLVIVDHGDATDILYGDEITRKDFEEVNREIMKSGGKPAKAAPVLSGITQAALSTQSLISAASFQNPTQGLLDAAFKGAEDRFLGCKENLIVAKKMPAGTGFSKEKHGMSAVMYNYCDYSQFEDDADWESRIYEMKESVENLSQLIKDSMLITT